MSTKMRTYLVIFMTFVLLVTIGTGCAAPKETPQPTPTPTPAPVATETPKPTYPEKEVEVVYHSSAGSGGDIFLRTMGKAVDKNLGKAWVVNNMPGASGANAWNYSAKAKPDGYTLLGISSTIITSPILNEMPVGYKDFEPVAMMFTDPMVLFVPADSKLTSIKDLVDTAKAKPGKVKFAGGTPGELGFVAGRELMKAAGFEIALVPFEGGGDAAVTVLGGHLDGGIGEYAEIASNVEAGKLRIIGSFNKMPLSPDIQTVVEAGYPEVKVEKLRGVLAPKGTPKEVIDIIAEAMKKALDDPDFKKYYEAGNLIPSFKAGDDFRKVMDEQDAQIRAAVGK
jgi:putative tricarboxylic transport membrane protein